MSITQGGNHAVAVTEEDDAAVVEQLLARFAALLATDRRFGQQQRAVLRDVQRRPDGAAQGTRPAAVRDLVHAGPHPHARWHITEPSTAGSPDQPHLPTPASPFSCLSSCERTDAPDVTSWARTVRPQGRLSTHIAGRSLM